MIRDLRTILDGWEYEPGKISVRKIIGRDGREKIQTRIDLGVLQLEVCGRPDGTRPNGRDSLLDYQEGRLLAHIELYGNDEDFVLTPEECRELRHEAYLYYQRYLSEFVLEDFDAVEQDTARNLRMIELCRRYAAAEPDRQMLTGQRNYVLMMNARARTYRALQNGAFDAALTIVNSGLAELRAETPAEGSDGDPAANELEVLRTLRDEVLARMPADSPARLRWEIDQALGCEDYARAAQLRDQLAELVRRQLPS